MTTVQIKDWAGLECGSRPNRTEQLVEVFVFLFLIVPSLVISLFVVGQDNQSFVLAAIASIFRDVALVGLILFFLWRNRESTTCIGWTRHHALRELILGVVLFVPLFAGAAVLEWALVHAGLSAPSTSLPSSLEAKSWSEALLALLLVTVVALAEETIFRGYLLLRLRAILGSTTAAVVLSSAIFAIGHGYEGASGVVTVGVMGTVFVIVYVWRGSLVAPIVMHFLQDFLSIVVLPFLGLK